MPLSHSLVPFDEDEKDPSVWFLDHDYLENMCAMFRKVNCEWNGEGGREVDEGGERRREACFSDVMLCSIRN